MNFWGKKNGIRQSDDKKFGMRESREKEAGMRDRDHHPPPPPPPPPRPFQTLIKRTFNFQMKY